MNTFQTMVMSIILQVDKLKLHGTQTHSLRYPNKRINHKVEQRTRSFELKQQ